VNVPLFDSLTHPLLRGTGSDHGSSFDNLLAQLDAANVIRACAVGIASVGGYEHEAFAKACSLDARLVPVAGVDPAELADRPNLVSELRTMGYQAVKIHPRRLQISLEDQRLSALLAELERERMTLFLCTYAYTAVEQWRDADPFAALVRLLKKFPALRTVLLHGGDVNVLRYAELVRHNHNLLLDLSFTLCKYEGSSIDLDLSFLFHAFDRRICVGSDFPDFQLMQCRERFQRFSEGIAADKVENIAFRNLSRFLGVEL
jgi:predicted TIM-barrel fold metal-dependent hydrolase